MKKMSATVYQQEERIAAGGAPLTRTAEFEELFRELVEEAGRALEEGELGWWAFLQEVLIPQIDAEIQSNNANPHSKSDSP
jgi:hypothetical protein